MIRFRLLLLSAAVLLVAVISGASWYVGSRIQSPAEAAARTEPPTPSPILVPVEKRVLSSKIVTRGTSRFGRSQQISLVPSALKPGPGIISTRPSPGQTLHEGDAFLTASGRPVFILQGETPVYRDFLIGAAGSDVKALETALQRLNFDPGIVDGTYDKETGRAVEMLYRSRGHRRFGPTETQSANVERLQAELALARNEAEATAETLDAAPRHEKAVLAKAKYEISLAEAQVEIKRAALERLQPQQQSLTQPGELAEAELASAIALVGVKRLEAEAAAHEAASVTRAAARAATLANQRLDRLAEILDGATAGLAAAVPADEIVFIPSLPVRVSSLKGDIGDAAIGTVATVTNHELAVDSSLRLEERGLVSIGTPVFIDEPSLGIRTTGAVSYIAEKPGTNGVDGYHVYFEILVNDDDEALAGLSLRLTLPVQSSGGPVTAVPASALFLSPDGTSRLQVARNGVIEFISVEPGLSADGFVEVKSGQTLDPGDLVVVGHE